MPNTAIRKLSSAGLSGEFGVESGLRVARCQVSLPSAVKTAGPWLLQKMMVVPGRGAPYRQAAADISVIPHAAAGME